MQTIDVKKLLKSMLMPCCAMVVASGCGVPLHEKTVELTVAHIPQQSLRVASANGQIEVVRNSGSEVLVNAVIRATSLERLEETTLQAVRTEDGTLSINALWPGNKRRSNEGCSISVAIPQVSDLDLESSNGALKASGFSCGARLKTSNGSVTLEDHTGPVHATTSNGRISVSGLLDSAQLKSSNGKITASGLSGAVEATTSNGSITLELSRSFGGALDLKTSNGSITIDSALEASVMSRSKKKAAKLQIGEKGIHSKATTSNGSIRVGLQE